MVSPGTGKLDRVRKLPIYAREGVRHVWLVDPLQRRFDVYRLEAAKWLLISQHADEEKVSAEPFESFEFDLAILWADVKL